MKPAKEKAVSAPTKTALKNLPDDQILPQQADPLQAWYGLAAGVKPSRDRHIKGSWKRGRK